MTALSVLAPAVVNALSEADLVTLETEGMPARFLLVPVDDALLDALAQAGEELADLEPDHDNEDGGDREPEEEDDDDADLAIGGAS
jgi:hypothetical protein